MAEPRQPQDRKPKQQKQAEPDELFSFVADGDTFTLPRSKYDYITPGYYMDHMDESEPAFVMKAFKLLADDDPSILGVLRRTGRDNVKDSQRIINDFVDYLGERPGE